MTSQYRHRRTSSPSTAFPNPLEPGEIAVNTANRQLAVGDAASGVTGVPLPLIAVRYFDNRAIYAQDALVVNGGILYRALGAAGPGAFNPAQWEAISGEILPQYVQKAGDTMAGPLVLPGDPTLDLQAATKHYVDDRVDSKSELYVSDTPPAGVPDNTLWWESDSGLLYVRYNDGNTTQWVIACPQPDTSAFVQKAGDTMSGPFTLAADPAAPLQAATMRYVDNALATNVPPPAFPSGTIMLFWQAAAPTGWTKITSQNDKALRVVSGAGGVAGGTNAFSTVMAQSVVGNHTLTLAETPAGMTSSGSGTIYTYPNGTGSYYVPMSVGGWAGAPITTATGYWVPYDASGNNNITYTNQWSGGNSFSVTNNNAGGGAHNHPITMAIQYIDVILASKN